MSAKLTPSQIVAAGQCLLPLNPPPTHLAITRVCIKIGKAFEVHRSTIDEAIALWNNRVERLRSSHIQGAL